MIHSTASVALSAQVHEKASVGPWCIVEANAKIAENVVLDARVHVFGNTSIGAGTHIFDGAVVGGEPQALKYKGEETFLEIGQNCKIREYATVNRGCGENGITKIENDVLLMAYSHVGHDCHLKKGVVISNGVQLGGHVVVGEFATVGGGTYVQQFAKIGAYSFAGGTLKIDRDVPPASRALGDPARFAGLNLHALKKHGFSEERIAFLEKNYRELYKSKRPIAEVILDFASGKIECDSLLKDFFSNFNGNLIAQIAQGSASE
ncbi:MAG: acyl-ACP--UDP-N-acetylglucosamine O-acyltransferase [Fibromonadaceae bacterium]|jgi:UDP-N-acetylglucosamine acyltransferase|nr:acyl-ACP--UDP-N-acetylglucosamine O-acyltransferase [Fibromonadaceae bacterium]